jgi:hypothetical protein
MDQFVAGNIDLMEASLIKLFENNQRNAPLRSTLMNRWFVNKH